jgi:hypothetical protein
MLDYLIQTVVTEFGSRLVGTAASYLGFPCKENLTWKQLIPTEIFRAFSMSLRTRGVLEIGHLPIATTNFLDNYCVL